MLALLFWSIAKGPLKTNTRREEIALGPDLPKTCL